MSTGEQGSGHRHHGLMSGFVTGLLVGFIVNMPDSMFDNFAGRGKHPPLTVIDEESEAPLGQSAPTDTPRQEAVAEATLFAVAALAAAGAFAVVGLTTVVIAIAVPSHWMLALAFTGAFVLVAIATGLAAVWHLQRRPRGQRLQELGAASRTAARSIRRRRGSRRDRQEG
jgi:hypothetical protein